MTKRERVVSLMRQGVPDHEIVSQVGCTPRYVRGVRYVEKKRALGLRSSDNLTARHEVPQPTYAIPRPCGPFEELAWKVREREARRRELVLGMQS